MKSHQHPNSDVKQTLKKRFKITRSEWNENYNCHKIPPYNHQIPLKLGKVESSCNLQAGQEHRCSCTKVNVWSQTLWTAAALEGASASSLQQPAPGTQPTGAKALPSKHRCLSSWLQGSEHHTMDTTNTTQKQILIRPADRGGGWCSKRHWWENFVWNYTANEGPSSHGCGFSNGHVWM